MIPPLGRTALRRWLQQRYYLQIDEGNWFCHERPHIAPSPSAHAFTKVCINRLLASTTAMVDFPIGSTAVKEIYAADLRTQIGTAVAIKVLVGSSPSAWYWFEQVTPGTVDATLPHPIEPDGVVADGLGLAGSGNAGDLCVPCHELAGTALYPAFGFQNIYTTTNAGY